MSVDYIALLALAATALAALTASWAYVAWTSRREH